MLKRIKALYEYTVRGTDGDNIGKIHDIYFDNCTWDVRYFIVDTGPWLFGRKVLLSPEAIQDIPISRENIISVNLTQEHIENSPEIDLIKPVSRQQLRDLHSHYGWPWQGARFPSPIAYAPPGSMPPASIPPTLYPPTEETMPKTAKQEIKAAIQSSGVQNPCLRSCREVEGYNVQATDGETGHVEDFFIEQDTWIVRYLLIDTRNWLPGKTVLIATDWITRIVWDDKDVYVDLEQDAIKNSPEYDRSQPLPRDYEMLLHQHYHRDGYWTDIQV